MQVITNTTFSSTKAFEDALDFNEGEVLFVDCGFNYIDPKSRDQIWPTLRFLRCDLSNFSFGKIADAFLYFDSCHLFDCDINVFKLSAITTTFNYCTINCWNNEIYTDCGFSNTTGQHVPMSCPSAGSFIAWKKARTLYDKRKIVKLLVPEDARRVSGNAKQCRVDKATVLGIYELDGETPAKEDVVYSLYTAHFAYKIGSTVRPFENFDGNRWRICSRGIHCFIDREDAIRYSWL